MYNKYNSQHFDENIPLPPKVKEILEEKELRTDIPQFHVILFDDSYHTYDYVIEMLMDIFGYSNSVAFQMACEVDVLGKVTVYTSNREHAEYKRDQIVNFGPDWRLDHSKSSMRATIIPAVNDTDIQQ